MCVIIFSAEASNAYNKIALTYFPHVSLATASSLSCICEATYSATLFFLSMRTNSKQVNSIHSQSQTLAHSSQDHDGSGGDVKCDSGYKETMCCNDIYILADYKLKSACINNDNNIKTNTTNNEKERNRNVNKNDIAIESIHKVCVKCICNVYNGNSKLIMLTNYFHPQLFRDLLCVDMYTPKHINTKLVAHHCDLQDAYDSRDKVNSVFADGVYENVLIAFKNILRRDEVSSIFLNNICLYIVCMNASFYFKEWASRALHIRTYQ